MPKTISSELALIINLKNAALDHKIYCEHECNVSLMQLKLAALTIAREVRVWEQDEAARIINEMPII